MLEEKDSIVEAAPVADANNQLQAHFTETLAWVLGCHSLTFFEFEKALIPKTYTLGKLFILLFMPLREASYRAAHPKAKQHDNHQGPKPCILGCVFGK